jgi:hypothetical protein
MAAPARFATPGLFARPGVLLGILPSLLLLGAAAAVAQGETYKARLSPTPVESANKAAITGGGSATATLTDRRLSVSGRFGGMQTAATIAQIHLGPRGVRGPVLFDLTVTKEAVGAGSIAGTFTLTPELVEAVKSSRLYVQIHSEKAPDGNLWGWLLP